jgi:NADPH-dependent ferric siderophore reductase
MLTGNAQRTSLGDVTTRAQRYDATVLRRDQISPHLVRLTLSAPGLETTGVPDEWVGLVVPGQFQVRYYTVRGLKGDEVVLDVVVHDEGLVTGWASGDCVGDRVVVTAPQSSFALPDGAAWLLLVGDLTAMPAMARIAESVSTGLDRLDQRQVRIWAEVPDDLTGYLPEGADVTWLSPPAPGQSRLAEVVESIDWPDGEGYFWMAGESAQMRAIRKHLMRERRLPSTAYDVMGYWRAVAARQLRAVDPEPIWRAGKAAGHSDEQIWAAYDEARGG